MLDAGDQAPVFSLRGLNGTAYRFESGAQPMPRLLVFFETDCPTCLLTIPYLNHLARALERSSLILGISQDGERETRELSTQAAIEFPVVLDDALEITKLYDPVAVPTLYLIDRNGVIIRT